ncbi:acyltransferase family protein [Proteus penneri]|uniref:acyltransferase family protein n=1 Tax=Proteus penneri TaxID=102862 RepID=UPI00288B825D|nr:acyltransferase [Proteus penneri]
MNKIKSIHHLRGIAAIMVVFFHMQGYLNTNGSNLGYILFGYGNAGVDLFFIISAYIICHTTKNLKKDNLLYFLIKRFFRIYPILIISILLWYIFLPGNKDISFLLKSMIPIHSNYSAGSPYFGFNLLYTAWTLTYEILFYLIFAICLYISSKNKNTICFLLITTLPIITQITFTSSLILNGNNKINILNGSILNLLSSPLLFDFSIGILIYKIVNSDYYDSIIKKNKKICIIVLMISIIISIYSIVTYKFSGHGPLGYATPCALLFLSLISIEKLIGWLDLMLFDFLGNISYSLYLTHIIFYHRLDGVSFLGKIYGLEKIITMSLICILFSYIFYKTIEMPSNRLGSFISKKFI